MSSLRTSGLAKLLGVTPQTVRKYAREGTIPFHKTPGSEQLFFTTEDVEEILGKTPVPSKEKWVYYLRSSSGRKSSFENQKQDLTKHYPEPIKIIKDSASGLNENRRGLNRIIKLAQDGEITDIAITNPDRLTRFGKNYIELLLQSYGVTTHYLNPDKDETPQEELLQDFMNLVTSFSGRFYKMRSKENKLKLLDKAKKEIKS